MRIAIVSTPFIRVPPLGYGGTELFCHELSEELHARGHEVTLFTTGDSQTSCPKRWLYPEPEWPPHAHDEINHVSWALEEVRGEGLRASCTSTAPVGGCPSTAPSTCPSSTPSTTTGTRRRHDLYAANPGVATYVAIQPAAAQQLEAPLVASVIHHGLRPDRYPPSEGDLGYLLHLGRYAPEKGTHLAVDVAVGAGLPLKLAGRTHPQDEAYVAAHLGPRLSRPGVEELGEADPPRKLALLRGARALLCPLQWEEPFGLIAIEAMLTGTPVLGFARGALPEIVEDGLTRLPSAPPRLMSRPLSRLATRLGGFDRRACARRARERFSAAVMTDAYEALYRRLCTQRRGASLRLCR